MPQRCTCRASGNLYGVTQQGGGTGSDGTVFELKPSAGGWTETILHRFNQTDGSLPQDGIIFDAVGSIYGTTYQGGLYNVGVVYKLTPNGNGGYTESALHNFTGGNDGANPFATPMFDPAGNLYGTASSGGNADNGNAGYGTVFVLAPSVKKDVAGRFPQERPSVTSAIFATAERRGLG